MNTECTKCDKFSLGSVCACFDHVNLNGTEVGHLAQIVSVSGQLCSNKGRTVFVTYQICITKRAVSSFYRLFHNVKEQEVSCHCFQLGPTLVC